jgi:hypothetical protein
MSRHVSDEDVVELAEGLGGEHAHSHLAACDGCARRVSEARQMLAVARAAELPEPPGSYWAGLVRAVDRRIDAEPRRGAAWGWLVPLAAAAAGIVVALTPLRGVGSRAAAGAPPAALITSWSALPPIEEDEALPILEAAGEPVTATLDDGRGLGSFVAGLTDEEAQTLADRLREPRKEREL